MMMAWGKKRPAAGGRGLIGAFGTDRRGAAAIEFAFIAPILFILYFLTMEISQAIETNKKVGRVNSMVADLITQQQDTSRADLDAIMQIGAAIMQPYNRSQIDLQITALEVVGSGGNARVLWSRNHTDGNSGPGAAAGSTIDIPANISTPGEHLVQVTTRLNYRPVIVWTAQQKAALGLAAAFDNIQMGEIDHWRPRMATYGIDCKDC